MSGISSSTSSGTTVIGNSGVTISSTTICDFSFFVSGSLSKKSEIAQIVVEEIVTPELPITVVPDEVLEEIPDIPEEITEETTEEIIEDSVEETPVQEAESLEEVISEENTVTDQQAPFVIGGGEDE